MNQDQWIVLSVFVASLLALAVFFVVMVVRDVRESRRNAAELEASMDAFAQSWARVKREDRMKAFAKKLGL